MNTRNLALAAVLIVIILGAGIYYYITLPATVNLVMKDPPIQAYDPLVTHINITFSSMQMHQIRSNGDSWINLTSNTNVTIDLIAIISTPQNLGSFHIPAGNYTEMRFGVIKASATIGGLKVDLTLTNSPNSLKIPIIGKLNLSANQGATITVDLRADATLLLQAKLNVTMTATAS